MFRVDEWFTRVLDGLTYTMIEDDAAPNHRTSDDCHRECLIGQRNLDLPNHDPQ